jgi:hypothetical protein
MMPNVELVAIADIDEAFAELDDSTARGRAERRARGRAIALSVSRGIPFTGSSRASCPLRP